MPILIALESLSFGGAQITTLRLAKELSKEDKVYIYVLDSRTNAIDVPENIKVYTKKIHPYILSLFDKIDKFFAKAGFTGISATACLYSHFLKDVVSKNQIDIIYSNGLNVDYLIARNTFKNAKKIVACHCEYKPSYLQNNTYRQFMAKYTLSNIDGFVYFTDESKDAFPYLSVNNSIVQIIKTGQFLSDDEIAAKLTGTNVSRQDFGIAESDFVFIVVSRAEKQKGWEETINAFHKVQSANPHTHLLLVGGDSLHDQGYIESLKKKYQYPNIHYTGYVKNTFPYISIADAGLLLSYKEVYPLVIIEYLCLNKPVIATATGEISQMTATGDISAGFTLPLTSEGLPDTEKISALMLRITADKEEFKTISNNTKIVRQKFNAATSLKQYQQIFYNILIA